jgi:hypothetical protein
MALRIISRRRDARLSAVARQQHRFVRCSGLHRTRIVAIASDRRNVTGPLSCADASSKMRSGRDVSQRAVAFTYLPHAKVYSPPHLSWGMDPPVRAASYWSENPQPCSGPPRGGRLLSLLPGCVGERCAALVTYRPLHTRKRRTYVQLVRAA